jgi:hypothetical protein
VDPEPNGSASLAGSRSVSISSKCSNKRIRTRSDRHHFAGSGSVFISSNLKIEESGSGRIGIILPDPDRYPFQVNVKINESGSGRIGIIWPDPDLC